MLIINDCHLGATRQGGTTPTSQKALKDYLRGSLSSLLDKHLGKHVVINGDLFDTFQVETSEVIEAHKILSRSLKYGLLTLICGNHDASAKGNKVSSWELLCHFLSSEAPQDFTKIDASNGLTSIHPGYVSAIPHMLNQSLFDLEIEKACAMTVKEQHLLLHCNYQNKFAEQADHSLNLSEQQTTDLLAAGWNLILGHEHIARSFHEGRVTIVGNQTPSSVMDCIGNEKKYALELNWYETKQIETWSAERSYKEVDWRHLVELDGFEFIRVAGEASAQEAAEVIKALSSLRQRSSAYVITNAVKIEGQTSFNAEEGLEEVRGFDVMAAIYEHLTPEETETVKGLLRD